ncbi:MAG TPA: energy transducer TonB [Myxococcota bacterium]|nr:energy transducer TonB [Myxococcota bacterium]
MRDRAREWIDADREDRREFRRWIALSVAGHALLLALLVWAPRPSSQAALPGAVMVDLVAMAVPASDAARPSRTPPPARTAPAAPIPPEPKPAPQQPAPPPPPTHEAVLPKEPQREPDKPKPSPKPEPKPEPEVAKAKPEPAPSPPKPEPPPKAPPAPDYDDVLSSLRAERGETRPERAPAPTAASPGAASAGAVAVTPEVAGWLRAARIAVRQAWALPAGFRNQPLETHVTVELDAQGNVLSEPRVTQRSGNPWYDESVVRAIQKASPLPRPPEAGSWPFVFRPEDLG